MSALAAQPGTLHYLAVSSGQVSHVNTAFLTDTGTSVGSAYPLISGGHRITVHIVGEVFDPGGDNIDMYVSPATAVRPGTSAQAYAGRISTALGRCSNLSE